jgi:hypothetical protein
LLARFSNLGTEARLFLVHAGAIKLLMEFFHSKDIPSPQDHLQAELPLPVFKL